MMCAVLIGYTTVVFPNAMALAEVQESALPDEFGDVIRTMASYGDRSTGTPGSEAAAKYIKERFLQLGF